MGWGRRLVVGGGVHVHPWLIHVNVWAAAAAKSLQLCLTLCDRIDSSPQTGAHQAPSSLGFSSKNTGVGCHFLLQCTKVKSESEVVQSCLSLSDPMDCSLPGSSIHRIFQAKEYWSQVPLPSLNAWLKLTLEQKGLKSRMRLQRATKLPN